MSAITIKTARRVIPMCYAYTTPQIRDNDGWIKIGFTEQDVETRIRQQTHTANIAYNVEWKANAIYDDGTGDSFSDRDFHAYLKKEGVERRQGCEWFYISPTESKAKFDLFRTTRGIFETTSVIPYKLRNEQENAVAQTKAYFNAYSDENPEFLWNAKPRFGKTLSSYDLCKQIGAKKVLIITNRPAIATSWYDDYVKFLGTDSGYYFISDADILKDKKFVVKREHLPSSARGYIEFISLQDLKGAIRFGGKYNKLNHIAEITWDLLIIDEAHEGVDTYKTDVAFDNIKRKTTLHLSGTPFKALANDKFKQDAIYNWTYADEQLAKKEWDNSSEEENPYMELPKIALYTYKMSDIVLDKVQQGADFNDDGEAEEYAFDLNEFFITDGSGAFVHNEAVDKFLAALASQEKFPFSTDELREELAHTLWLLNRVESARALAKKLKNHPVFKDYAIVLAAGDGIIDDNDVKTQSYQKVKNAIRTNDKTITLSVGQLTTGITVKEWTAVLMLSNVQSPALYMQAAFRAQNPCLQNKNGQMFRKETAYIFDFDPARTLTIYEQIANDLAPETAAGKGDMDTRKQNIRELLNFFPVYGEDENGSMIELDAEKVLTIPRKIHAQEVVKKGFMCNFLFQNISNIFRAPKEVIDILKQFTPQKEPVAITPTTTDDLSLNDENEVEVSEEMKIGLADDIFGPKIYEKLADNLEESVNKAQEENKDANNSNALIKQLKDNFNVVSCSLIDKAKESYGSELKPSTKKKLERVLRGKSEQVIEKKVGNYQIQQNVLNQNRENELQTANTKAEQDIINKRYDIQSSRLEEQFKEEITNTIQALPKQYAETIVQIQETDKRQRDKEDIEESVKDHLRGFARTIPSFLMAYGNEETTLDNFDTIIPAEVFKEVASISLDEFRFLRDGGDYNDAETGELKHYEGHLFDPVVFDDSVKEFLRLKEKLADYFNETSKEDIFDYIPPQKTNQIFTPKKVVIEMVDALQKENPSCFDEPDKTFIDLYMKSGLYIAEIVKRLYRSEEMKKQFPDKDKRLKHIFANQVYGLAPTEIIYRIAVAYVLGFNTDKEITKHNLKHFDTLPAVQAKTLEQDLDRLFVV